MDVQISPYSKKEIDFKYTKNKIKCREALKMRWRKAELNRLPHAKPVHQNRVEFGLIHFFALGNRRMNRVFP